MNIQNYLSDPKSQTNCPYERKIDGDLRHRRGKGYVTTGQGTLAATRCWRGKNWIPPRTFKRNPVLLTARFLASSFKNWEKINFCGLTVNEFVIVCNDIPKKLIYMVYHLQTCFTQSSPCPATVSTVRVTCNNADEQASAVQSPCTDAMLSCHHCAKSMNCLPSSNSNFGLLSNFSALPYSFVLFFFVLWVLDSRSSSPPFNTQYGKHPFPTKPLAILAICFQP